MAVGLWAVKAVPTLVEVIEGYALLESQVTARTATDNVREPFRP